MVTSIKGNIVYNSFIDQEVEDASRQAVYKFNRVVTLKNEKDHFSLRYTEFVIILVKAVQEQQKMIEELQKEISELKKGLIK